MAIKMGAQSGRLAAAETRFDRGAALVLAAALAFAALMVAMTLSVLSLPADGWQIPGSVDTTQLVYFYGDWPTPLRAGDAILTVNGYSLDSQAGGWLRPLSPSGWQAGATIIYTVRRDNEVLTVPVVLHQPDPASKWRALGRALRDTPTEWSWPIIALVVFWLRPGSHAARLLLFIMVSYVAVVKVGWAATVVAENFAPPWLFYASLIGSNFWLWLFWPTIIWLVLSFPRTVFPLSRWPRQVLLLYGLPAACLAATLLTVNLGPYTVGLVSELALLLLALLFALISIYRHSEDAVARAQVAWLILGFALSQGLALTVYLLGSFWPIIAQAPGWITWPFPLALPICLGIAITRYRLFDIDVIIRRTLLYSALTALLAGVYFGSIVVLQSLLAALTPLGGAGGAARSELVTVVSTLVIAVLFVPLRRRLQDFIDRRFYRRKVNAAMALAAFAQAARDEVDLDRLSDELVRVVQDTLQPETVQLWVSRPGEPRGP